MSVIRLDKLLDVDETKRDANIVRYFQYFREIRWHSQPFSEIMLPDLWAITCSYLFNFETTYTLSVPLGELYDHRHILRYMNEYETVRAEDGQNLFGGKIWCAHCLFSFFPVAFCVDPMKRCFITFSLSAKHKCKN